MSESNPEPGLISDDELPEDLQPDENSVTEAQPLDPDAERDVPNDTT